MKKAALIIVVLLAVVTASVLWVRGQIGITDPALLVSPEAAMYVTLPDLPRSYMRWPKTTLSKISAEQEMKDFLQKPVEFLSKERGGNEASTILMGLKPGRIYAAALAPAGGDVQSVLGFQYWGSRSEFDKAIARMRAELHRGAPPETTKEDHLGTEISSSTLPDGSKLFTATQSRWGLLSNNREALVAVIDRAAGRSTSPSLATDPAYIKVLENLPKESDLLAFVRPGQILDVLLDVGSQLGAAPDPKQVEQIRKAEAAGFALKLDGADLRDALFLLRPNPPNLGALNHQGLALTSAKTMGYFGFLLQYDVLAKAAKDPSLQKYVPGSSGGAPSLFDRLAGAFGKEASISFAWPVERMTPELLVSAAVIDPAQVEEILMEATSMLPETTVIEKNGSKYYTFPTLRSTFLDPTLAVSTDLLVFGLNPGEVDMALANRGNSENLKSSPAFAPALPALATANETFGFIDSKALFERAFPLLRQIITFGSSFMPGADQFLDASKIPQTETISKHLTPIIFSQTRLDSGYLIESSGPITMNQAAILTIGSGAAFLGPQLLNQQ
ncbi:MAG: hypothetical protein WEB60_08330 [Terrimicrobiaceae bacterium]